MTITECVYGVLSVDAALIAAIPANEIKSPGAWSGRTLPYIEHRPVTVEPLRVQSGLEGGKRWSYQVDVFASEYGPAEADAFLVVAALEGTHQLGSPVSDVIHCHWTGGLWYAGREAENEVEHFILQFDITQVAV